MRCNQPSYTAPQKDSSICERLERIHAKCLEIQHDYDEVFLPVGSQGKDLPVEFCSTKPFQSFIRYDW